MVNTRDSGVKNFKSVFVKKNSQIFSKQKISTEIPEPKKKF
jgi:hypothetical protein